MDPLSIAGGVLGLGKSLFGLFQGHKANQIHPEYTPYEISPEAKLQLGTAEQMFNGRMAGAGAEERNIENAQSNFSASAERNATNGAQALALDAAGQGQANDAFNQLQVKENQNKYGLLSNLNQAFMAMTNERNKVYQDKLNKYMLDVNAKNKLSESAANNVFGGLSDALSFGIIGRGNSGGGAAAPGGPNMNPSLPEAPVYSPGAINPALGLQFWTPPYKFN